MRAEVQSDCALPNFFWTLRKQRLPWRAELVSARLPHVCQNGESFFKSIDDGWCEMRGQESAFVIPAPCPTLFGGSASIRFASIKPCQSVDPSMQSQRSASRPRAFPQIYLQSFFSLITDQLMDLGILRATGLVSQRLSSLAKCNGNAFEKFVVKIWCVTHVCAASKSLRHLHDSRQSPERAVDARDHATYRSNSRVSGGIAQAAAPTTTSWSPSPVPLRYTGEEPARSERNAITNGASAASSAATDTATNPGTETSYSSPISTLPANHAMP
jgi:hypothetical protein